MGSRWLPLVGVGRGRDLALDFSRTRGIVAEE